MSQDFSVLLHTPTDGTDGDCTASLKNPRGSEPRRILPQPRGPQAHTCMSPQSSDCLTFIHNLKTSDPSIFFRTPQNVEFTKQKKDGETIHHKSRIISYVDVKKRKLISQLTNDMESDPEEIVAIYRKRWEIELLFKQMKQNFPLKYFYGESANAIKIQIWVTLIANLLLMVMRKGLTRQWSFSGLATMVRITLMYYVDFHSLFNNPEKEWEIILSEASGAPPEPSLFD